MSSASKVCVPQSQPSESQSYMSRGARWNALVSVTSVLYEEVPQNEMQQPMEASEENSTPLDLTVPKKQTTDAHLGDDECDDDPHRLVIDEDDESSDASSEVNTPVKKQPENNDSLEMDANDTPKSGQNSPEVMTPNEIYRNRRRPRLWIPEAEGQYGGPSRLNANETPRTSRARSRLLDGILEPVLAPDQIPMSYNRNMARVFPGAEYRTPQQQARRERNNVASRRSRAKARIFTEILRKQLVIQRKVHDALSREVATMMLYANVLLEKLKIPPRSFAIDFDMRNLTEEQMYEWQWWHEIHGKPVPVKLSFDFLEHIEICTPVNPDR